MAKCMARPETAFFFLFLFLFLLFIDEERTNKFVPREAQIRNTHKRDFCRIMHSDRTDIQSLRMCSFSGQRLCLLCVHFKFFS